MKIECDKDTITKICILLMTYIICSVAFKLFTYEKDIELRLALVQEQDKELKQEEAKAKRESKRK